MSFIRATEAVPTRCRYTFTVYFNKRHFFRLWIKLFQFCTTYFGTTQIPWQKGSRLKRTTLNLIRRFHSRSSIGPRLVVLSKTMESKDILVVWPKRNCSFIPNKGYRRTIYHEYVRRITDVTKSISWMPHNRFCVIKTHFQLCNI